MIHRLSLSADSQISIVKLIQNFRSHEAILKFPNERFYGGDLVPRAPSQDINTYLGSSYLPNKKFPVVFHAMFGKDDREASSPSFFNIDEVTQVKLYVGQLKEDRTFRTRLFFFFFPLRHVLELKFSQANRISVSLHLTMLNVRGFATNLMPDLAKLRSALSRNSRVR